MPFSDGPVVAVQAQAVQDVATVADIILDFHLAAQDRISRRIENGVDGGLVELIEEFGFRPHKR